MSPKRIFSAVVLALLGFAIARPAFAVTPEEMLKNPKLEARAEKISRGLRCLVCQNESIEDSNAELAHDIRVLVRKRVLAGDTNAQVRAYLVSRYGNFILLKPPFERDTLLLWLSPFGLLALGGVAVFWRSRVKRTEAAAAPLSPDENAKLNVLLTESPGDAQG